MFRKEKLNKICLKKHKLIHAWQSLALIIYGLHLILVSSSLDNNGSFARLEQFGFLWRFSSFPNILSVPFLHISQWKIYGVDMIDLAELSWLRILGSSYKNSNWDFLGYKSLDAIVQIGPYLNLILNPALNNVLYLYLIYVLWKRFLKWHF